MQSEENDQQDNDLKENDLQENDLQEFNSSKEYYYLFLPILVSIFFILLFFDTSSYKAYHNSILLFDTTLTLPLQNTRTKDTIFVMGNSYVEISLKEQLCRLYARDTTKNKTYKISSGTTSLPEGLETPTGLYCVQTKTPLGISRQFNNAELHHWVGFNVNFGIHGLKGEAYYRHLGVRPSSNGCVRISKADAEDLYRKVKLGTPLLVYKEEPAIKLSFIDSNDINMKKMMLIP